VGQSGVIVQSARYRLPLYFTLFRRVRSNKMIVVAYIAVHSCSWCELLERSFLSSNSTHTENLTMWAAATFPNPTNNTGIVPASSHSQLVLSLTRPYGY
jgi:hypothetical protein